jgi:hypothetical protein
MRSLLLERTFARKKNNLRLKMALLRPEELAGIVGGVTVACCGAHDDEAAGGASFKTEIR